VDKIPQHEIIKHYLISKRAMGESVRDIFVDFPITEFTKIVEVFLISILTCLLVYLSKQMPVGITKDTQK
jgi:hypothetical protein